MMAFAPRRPNAKRYSARPMIDSTAGAYYANGLQFTMRFIESPVFTASLRRHLDDEQYRAMQAALGRGKRGGVRTIYYWVVDDDLCYMVYMYAKSEQSDLSPTQIRALARVVREEFT